ncbi:MAG: cation:proton antiporter [Bradyrhizobium sp.]
MNFVLTNTVELLIAAVVVAMLARRIRLPYTVGLVLTGVAIALLRSEGETYLTHDLVFRVILPPLLFEAAINIRWQELRRDALPVLVLAVAGTLLAAAAVAAGLVVVLGWPFSAALLFGALIAATDPVAVIAMFKDNGITGRLRLLVESESLLNDGVAAVLFTLALAWAQGGSDEFSSPAALAAALLLTVGGGLVIGITCAGLAIAIAGRTADHLIESTLTAVTAYGSFILAEHLHFSGVLATVAAGLLIGNLGILADDERSRITPRGREFTLALWDFIAFVTNSLVFLLIGANVAAISFERLGSRTLATVIALVLLGRAITVYPLCLPFCRSHWVIPLRAQHILWWGGLRGALGLALALSLPPGVPMRDEMLVATFGVVAFSVIIQGVTMPLLLRHSRLPAQKPGAFHPSRNDDC